MNRLTYRFWLLPLLAVMLMNLAWEHQALLTSMVDVHQYYQLAAHEPFVYRMLPALLYRACMGGSYELATGLNAPFDASSSLFQLVVDLASLGGMLWLLERLVWRLNPQASVATRIGIAVAGELLIVVFGFFMVPNRAFFYPYDFPDLFFVTLIAWLAVPGPGRHPWFDYLLPVAIFVATLNKETGLFYSGLYIAFRATRGYDWRRTTLVIGACIAAAVAAREVVNQAVHSLHAGSAISGMQYELNLYYTIAQLRNPLFLFSMLNVFSYLYVPVFLLRRHLDRTDMLILGLVVLWTAIMMTVGIVRELRIFAPASLMLLIILLRHLGHISAGWRDSRPLGARSAMSSR